MKIFKKTAIFKGISLKGEGEGEGEKTFSQSDIDAAVLAASQSNDGLKNKNAELLAKVKLQGESIKRFDGIDPDAMKNMMETFDKNEELKLISEGKYEEVINNRTEKERAGYTASIDSLEKELDTFKDSDSKQKNQIRDLIIDTSLVSEFRKQEGLESASEDLKLRAQKVWTLEEGVAVPRGIDGEILTGKEGVMTKTEWINSLKENAQHLFPSSNGAGTGGSGGKGGSGNALTDKMQSAAATGDMKLYRQLRAELKKSKEA